MNRVLVVDDDLGIREMLRAILELEGFAVTLASGGAQALALLTEAREPWVVLMDVMMPGLTGLDVCARLREAGPVGARHHVALMTAGLLDDDECPLPARTILRKPFDLDTVVGLVTRLAHDLTGAPAGGSPGVSATLDIACGMRTIEAAHAAAAL